MSHAVKIAKKFRVLLFFAIIFGVLFLLPTPPPVHADTTCTYADSTGTVYSFDCSTPKFVNMCSWGPPNDESACNPLEYVSGNTVVVAGAPMNNCPTFCNLMTVYFYSYPITSVATPPPPPPPPTSPPPVPPAVSISVTPTIINSGDKTNITWACGGVSVTGPEESYPSVVNDNPGGLLSGSNIPSRAQSMSDAFTIGCTSASGGYAGGAAYAYVRPSVTTSCAGSTLTINWTIDKFYPNSATYPISYSVGTTSGGTDIANNVKDSPGATSATVTVPSNGNYYATVSGANTISGSPVTVQSNPVGPLACGATPIPSSTPTASSSASGQAYIQVNGRVHSNFAGTNADGTKTNNDMTFTLPSSATVFNAANNAITSILNSVINVTGVPVGTPSPGVQINNYNVNLGPNLSYANFYARVQQTPTQVLNGLQPTADGVYVTDGDYTAGNWTISNNSAGHIVIFVPGNLFIDNDIHVAPGAFLAFIVKGNINIDAAVKNVDGIYYAAGDPNDPANKPGTICTKCAADGSVEP